MPKLVKMTEKERARLARIERAHSAYLIACQKMSARRLQIVQWSGPNPLMDPHYARGWLACLREFSQAVVDADRELDEQEGLDTSGTMDAGSRHGAERR